VCELWLANEERGGGAAAGYECKFSCIGGVCRPDLSVEPAATVGATVERVSKGSHGVVTSAGSAAIGTVVCTAAMSVEAEPLLGTILISAVTAVAVATIVVVAIGIAIVAVVVAIVVGIVVAVVVAVAVAIIIAVAPTIVVIVIVVVVVVATIVAEHGSHHILHLGSHGSLAGLKISFPALEAVGSAPCLSRRR
jgi:hypothetical protein